MIKFFLRFPEKGDEKKKLKMDYIFFLRIRKNGK